MLTSLAKLSREDYMNIELPLHEMGLFQEPLPSSLFQFKASNSSTILSTAVGLNDLLQEEFKGCKKVHFLSNEKLEKLGYILTNSLHLFSSYTLKRLVYRYGSWKVLKAYRLHGGNVEVLLAKMNVSVTSYELV